MRWKIEQHTGRFALRKREPGGSVAVAVVASRARGKPEQHETLSLCDVLSPWVVSHVDRHLKCSP